MSFSIGLGRPELCGFSSQRLLKQRWSQPAVAPQLISSALFSPDDYPLAAVLLGQEGEVEAELTVAADGTPRNCTIVHSSGFPALDAATCTKFKARARFRPALDELGRPTTGTWNKKVRWAIEGNELPVAPWAIRLMAAIDRHGSATNCAIQAGGVLKRDEFLIDCRELSGAFAVPPELAGRFAGHEAVLVFDQQFVPGNFGSIDTPKDLIRFPLLSRQAMRLAVDPSGRVSTCTPTKSEGDYKPSTESCDTMRARRFKPYADRNGQTVEATATTAIYAYVR